MSKAFASQADLADKQVSFTKLSDNAYAYTAEGDPNTGVIIGDDAVMVIDTQATPVMARDVIRHIRQVTDKPMKYVVLSHYHAVRVLGASAYEPQHIIASRDTYDLIVERGDADKASEIGRDLVEFDATPYAGDAYFQDWPQTLDKLATLQARALVPGRGAALTTPDAVAAGLAGTR